MNRLFKTSAVAATVLAASMAGATSVWADSDRHGGDGYRHQKHGHDDHRWHRDDWRRHRDARPRVYRSYGHGHHDHDDDGRNVLLGLVVGGVIGYAIGNQQPAYQDYPPPVSQTQEYYPATPSVYSSGNASCLQEREYQTKVIIGGKQVDAYGTACLQPDGSWRRGPAQLVSY